VPEAAKLADFLKSVRPRAARAKELGVTLAIENHGSGFDDIRRFADAAGKDGVGVALAPYHLPQDAAKLASLIEELDDRLPLFQPPAPQGGQQREGDGGLAAA
jgi:sugar phosphate isomerase/epimerase